MMRFLEVNAGFEECIDGILIAIAVDGMKYIECSFHRVLLIVIGFVGVQVLQQFGCFHVGYQCHFGPVRTAGNE